MPMQSPAAPTPARLRRRHWRNVALLVAGVLLVYLLGLAWITHYVETGVEHSLHPLPVVLQARKEAAQPEP